MICRLKHDAKVKRAYMRTTHNKFRLHALLKGQQAKYVPSQCIEYVNDHVLKLFNYPSHGTPEGIYIGPAVKAVPIAKKCQGPHPRTDSKGTFHIRPSII